MFREAPLKNGMFDYVEFTRILKHGKKEEAQNLGTCCATFLILHRAHAGPIQAGTSGDIQLTLVDGDQTFIYTLCYYIYTLKHNL